MTTNYLDWPDVAVRFAQRYAAFEGRLKLAGHVRGKRKEAQADWSVVAAYLGPSFFETVRDSGDAPDLINEPPRTRMANSLLYEPEVPEPIGGIDALFTRGICKVRHNLVHGEKFVVSGAGWDRDVKLVTQALSILEKAACQSEALFASTTSAGSV